MFNYRSIFLLLLITISLGACKKEIDYAFTKSPDERLNETIAKFQSQLTSAKNGWKALIYPAGGGTYSFYFNFNDSNRVKMLSDFDSASSVTIRESSYRLKALQQISLLFDTYSYIHVLSDPDARVNGGQFGAGLQSDFEYYFDSSSTDTIRLVGRFNQSKAVLIRATAQEAVAYNSGQLASSQLINKILTYFKRMTIGNQLFDVQINTRERSFTFTWVDANNIIQTFTSNYYSTINGIVLQNPLTVGNLTVTALTNISWNASTETINMQVNGAAATITGIVVPLKIDVGAPRRWWNYSAVQDSYWVTESGFHVNGVDDAFGWANVPNYNGFTIFWAKFGTSGGINYDLVSPITNNAISFGAAYRPTVFTTDGRAVFPLLGTLGTVPPNASASYLSLRNKMAEPGGFYFVQIDKDGLVYDMVSATDGKSWVRWEW